MFELGCPTEEDSRRSDIIDALLIATGVMMFVFISLGFIFKSGLLVCLMGFFLIGFFVTVCLIERMWVFFVASVLTALLYGFMCHTMHWGATTF